jgi:diadenylate cyclase
MDLVRILVALVEIGIIAAVFNILLSFMWNTRAMDVVIGFVALLLLFATANLFGLPVIKQLMVSIINVVVLAILIIFQNEIRMALSRVWTVRGRRYAMGLEYDQFIEGLASSVYHFSNMRLGALVVLENQNSLSDYIYKGVRLDAEFSSELLESVFISTTPLHDGAVIMQGRQLAAACVILPLADDTSAMVRKMGTRHRAALGLSQITDALIVVVSEETGSVSIARDGILTRGIKKDRFIGILKSIYGSSRPQSSKFNLWDWLKGERKVR